MSFQKVLTKYRDYSFSERDKGDRFERLMRAYLKTDPKYANRFKKVWLWEDFIARRELGGRDSGIDLVALTIDGDYWAIQCKCYDADALIDKPSVDSFLATSSREFKDENMHTTRFSQRLWISTTNNWGSNAEEAIKNQNPPVIRLNLSDLKNAPVDWVKLENGISGAQARTEKYELRKHQLDALEKTHEHFKNADRGKLIMACGTGKTFNSLRIAEHETDNEGLILFLVPSISLLGQTLREWSAQAEEPLNAICICSDPKVSRDSKKAEDSEYYSTIDLAMPASTDTKTILHQFRKFRKPETKGMTVVFSTYQSIDVIAKAQKEFIKSEGERGIFDLIICDEAHRTTGAAISKEDLSHFSRVHHNEFIKGRKRIYMTATPRLYGDKAKSKAAEEGAVLCSMDDPELYGDEMYRIGFGKAVDLNLLTDYKVLILTLSEQDVPPSVQRMIASRDQEITSDDASKLIGCINAMSKQVIGDADIIKNSDPEPMKKAVAFTSRIADSKKITNIFNSTTETYINTLPPDKQSKMNSVSSKHIDGTMSAPKRDEILDWLEDADQANGEARVITNVRCLSEGVDVPSLDSVMFLSARNSQVDVVQSVGRVMRRSEGKKYGYIIIPVVIPTDVEPEKALDDNERYSVVWSVLNALRAHDDRFDATINKIDLNKKRPDNILIGGADTTFENGEPIDRNENGEGDKFSKQFAMQFNELQDVMYARLVKKVGDKRYWEDWAKSVGKIAERQYDRIKRLINETENYREAFDDFLEGLHANINPSLNEDEAIEMLSQHIITKPVFEALFEGYSFVEKNAVSQSMSNMLDLLEEQALEKDAKALDEFYRSVKIRAQGIDNVEGKQRLIVELYDKFFKTAFPKLVEKLGIVYTPVEVVDFINYSVNDILKKEFDRSISDENIHLLDPFTGTGTFITRLIQSGLIKKEDLRRKYHNEIHANEIVLLAYYIAAVNIENSFHDAMDLNSYESFDGICLTDSFQLGEDDHGNDLFSEMFPQNSERVTKQKEAPLRVILGNPPYSIGQKSANDNAQNQEYEKLNNRIANTYADKSSATLHKSLYDAYIKAFRWSTDRLDPKNGGVIAFVSNASWIRGNSQDGFRKCIEKEFSSIYVFDLRGNQRTSGELSRKEGGKIFGSGSRAPIAITLLVKNPSNPKEKADIKYYDIGDYLDREEKLSIVADYKSVGNTDIGWKKIKPNEHGDWLDKRSSSFNSFINIEPKSKKKEDPQSFFSMYGPGISTARDTWLYNFSKNRLKNILPEMVRFYNKEREKFKVLKNEDDDLEVADVIDNNPKKISWTRGLRRDVKNDKSHSYNENYFRKAIYRPFVKNHLYFDEGFIESPGINSSLFPTAETNNRVIAVSSKGTKSGLSILITDCLGDYHLNGDAKMFPLYYYEEQEKTNPSLFDEGSKVEYVRRDGITNFILDRASAMYGKRVSKEDIFYYVYGILHSREYRQTFSSDLKKMLPKIPLVDKPKDFWSFSNAGRNLADLHINYEDLPKFEKLEINGEDSEHFEVKKMRFAKLDGDKNKSKIIYNNKITISNVPDIAYKYKIRGRSAIEWIMDRYQVKTDKNTGIKNDPNDWAREVGNPRYILDLLLSVINLSVQTVDIINDLPDVDFESL